MHSELGTGTACAKAWGVRNMLDTYLASDTGDTKIRMLPVNVVKIHNWAILLNSIETIETKTLFKPSLYVFIGLMETGHLKFS